MNSTAHRKAVPLMMLSVLAVLGMVLAGITDSDAATGEDLTGYGAVNEINIAPGYQWTYTATFPEDLEDGTETTLKINEMGSIATMGLTDHTLQISRIPESMAGKRYNLVIEAVHAESGQTAHQWIRINVTNSMTVDHTGCINEIIKGASQNITLTATGGIGDISWKVKTGTTLPAGLALSGNKVTGTPTQLGKNTINLTATSTQGESKDLTIEFTAFSKIVGGSAETVNAIKGTAIKPTAAITNGSDIGVTWAVTSGSFPTGITHNASTGVVSGTYTGATAGQSVVTLTGTATNGPAQTATKKVTINYEPEFLITGPDTILTYKGNSPKVVAFSISGQHTAITWSTTVISGISISQDGKLTISGSTAVGGGIVTVTAKSAAGQTQVKNVQYTVEDTLSITGPDKLVATAGIPSSQAYTVTGGSSNTVQVGSNTYNGGLTFSDGKLHVSFPTAHASEKVTLTATSAAGQTATKDVNVVVYSAIGFNSVPGADGIIAFVK